MDDMASDRDGSNDIEDPVDIARAIQVAISRSGTKPHWYMRDALPEINRILYFELLMEMHRRGPSGRAQKETGVTAGLRVGPNERLR